MSDRKTPTTETGIPVGDKQNSLTAGPRGPLLTQDWQLFEKHAHFNRERIPERIVHAKGSAAHGTLTITQDSSRYTKATLFSAVGNNTPVFFVRDPLKFPDFIHTQKRDPRTNLRSLPADRKARFLDAMAGAMKSVPEFIQRRRIGHCSRADPACGSD